MGRSHGVQIKWGMYSLGYLITYLLKILVFNRIMICGAVPELAPIAVAAVGCFEGSLAGCIYGLFVGFFCCSVYYRAGSMMIAVCAIIGLLSGFTTHRRIGGNIIGVSLCSIIGIVILEASRILYYHFICGNPLEIVLKLGVPEGVYSAIFIIPVYLLFATIYIRFRTDTEL